MKKSPPEHAREGISSLRLRTVIPICEGSAHPAYGSYTALLPTRHRRRPPPPSFSAHVPPFPASAQKRKTTFRHSPKSFACLHENPLSSSCAPGALRFEPPFLRHACRVRRPAFRFCPAPAPRLKRRICSFCNRYVQDYNKNCHKRLRLFVNHIIYFHKIIKKLP